MTPPPTKMIGGQKFFRDSYFERKAAAKKQAAYLRIPGTLSVRVVQTHGVWAVYRYHRAGARVERKEKRRFRKKGTRK